MAAIIRVSTFLVLLSPTRSNSPSCNTRKSLTWSLGDVLLISSRNILPVCAASNRPVRLSTAPVNEPLTCPKSSLSSRLSVKAPQFTRIYGPVDRGLRSWIARAINSLPVPVSPTISTQARDGATWRVVRTTSRRPRLEPITPGSVSSSLGLEPSVPAAYFESAAMPHPSRIG